jgi:transcriptional regulator with XRE-family HTH domain
MPRQTTRFSLLNLQRFLAGLTLRELAAKVGTSASTLLRIEQGQPPSDDLRLRLARYFNNTNVDGVTDSVHASDVFAALSPIIRGEVRRG